MDHFDKLYCNIDSQRLRIKDAYRWGKLHGLFVEDCGWPWYTLEHRGEIDA